MLADSIYVAIWEAFFSIAGKEKLSLQDGFELWYHLKGKEQCIRESYRHLVKEGQLFSKEGSC